MKAIVKKIIAITLSVAILLSTLLISGAVSVSAAVTVWDGTIATEYASGTGTSSDPYIIETPQQLALAVNSFGGTLATYFKLAKDIYLNDVTASDWATNEATKNAWFTGSASGNSAAYYAKTANGVDDTTVSGAFVGHLDGNGCCVYGLWYGESTTSLASALVPVINGGSIKNIGIKNAQIIADVDSGSNTYAAPICALTGARKGKDITVEGCFSDADVYVNSKTTVGGIIGYAQTTNSTTAILTVKNCYSLIPITSLVVGTSAIGSVGNKENGIIGEVYNCRYYLQNCYSIARPFYPNQSGYDRISFLCYDTTNKVLTSDFPNVYSGVYNTSSAVADLDEQTHVQYTDTTTGKVYSVYEKIDAADMQGENARTSMPELFADGTTFTTTETYPILTIFKEEEITGDITVTFNANGGSFSDGATSKDSTETVGSEIACEAPSLENRKFLGWSLTVDGAVIDTTVTGELKDETLYAVWAGAHDGEYKTSQEYIDFSEYDVLWESGATRNSYYMSYDTDGDGKNDTYVPYFTKIEDATATGGAYLRYKSEDNQSTNWEPNHGFVANASGTVAEAYFPEATTYRLTLRYRTQSELPEGGMKLFVAYAYSLTGIAAAVEKTNYTVLAEGIEESGEWTELVCYFTTPDEYYVDGSNIYNKLFIGFYPGPKINYSYDLDTVKIEAVTVTNLYIPSNSGTTLYKSLYGQPGEEIGLPASFIEEVYSTTATTATTKKYTFGKWYSDSAFTTEAIDKFGNFDQNYYCASVDIAVSSAESQEGFCGFDEYYVQAEGMQFDKTAVTLSDEKAYTGEISLKATLSAGSSTAFEVRNNNAFEVKNGKTYKLSFYYNSDSDFEFGIGLADAGKASTVAQTAKSVSLAGTGEWSKGELIFSADLSSMPETVKGYVLAATASADSDATVYIDSMVLSSVTASVGGFKADEDAMRYMFEYNCGGDDTVVIEDAEYAVTEHGVLVTGADNETSLVLENVGTNGVMQVANSALTYWSRNSVTGATVYSVYIKGFDTADDYQLSARGYVKLSNGEVYYSDILTSSYNEAVEPAELISAEADITTADNVTSFGDYYIWLPAGSEIASDKELTVTTYNSVFSQKTGYYADGTVKTSCYVQLSVADSSFDSVSITVPCEALNEVKTGTKEYLSYGIECETVSKKLAAAETAEAVNYIFITDIHTGALIPDGEYQSLETVYDKQAKLRKQMEIIVQLANSDKSIDFIAVGGDIVNGYETDQSPEYQAALDENSELTIRDFVIDQMQAVLDPLTKSEKPVFILFGNHDDNHAYSYMTDETHYDWVIGDTVWNNEILGNYSKGIVKDTAYANSKYYYYDLENKKTRVICMDIFDHRRPEDENGYVTGEGVYGGYVYTPEQLSWLVNEALTAEEGWDYIFLSHMGIDHNTTSSLANDDVMRDILKAYQTKGTYTAALTAKTTGETVEIKARYTAVSENDRIIAYQFGHNHEEKLTYSEELYLWQICSGKWSNPAWPLYDVMSASDEVVYKFNVGYGTDARLIYPE